MSFDNQLSSQFKDQEDSYNAIILLYDYSYDKEQGECQESCVNEMPSYI